MTYDIDDVVSTTEGKFTFRIAGADHDEKLYDDYGKNYQGSHNLSFYESEIRFATPKEVTRFEKLEKKREKARAKDKENHAVIVCGSTFIKVNIEAEEHNDIKFGDKFRELNGKTKYKAIKDLFKAVLKGKIKDAVISFPILREEKDGEWLMKKLDKKGFTWFDKDERLVGVDDGNGIEYWFAVSLGDAKKLLRSKKK